MTEETITLAQFISQQPSSATATTLNHTLTPQTLSTHVQYAASLNADSQTSSTHRFNLKGLSIPIMLFMVFMVSIATIVYILLPQSSTIIINLNPNEQYSQDLSGFWFNSFEISLKSHSNIPTTSHLNLYLFTSTPLQLSSRLYTKNQSISINNQFIFQNYYLGFKSSFHLKSNTNGVMNYLVLVSQDAYQKWRKYGYINAESIMLQGSLDYSGEFKFYSPASDYYYIVLYSTRNQFLSGTVLVGIEYKEYNTQGYSRKIEIGNNTVKKMEIGNIEQVFWMIQSESQDRSWRYPDTLDSDQTYSLSYSTHSRPGVFIVWWPMWTITTMILIGLITMITAGFFVVCSSLGIGCCDCIGNGDDEERIPLLQEDIEPLPLYEAHLIVNGSGVDGHSTVSPVTCPSYHSVDSQTGDIHDVNEEEESELESHGENGDDAIDIVIDLPPSYKEEGFGLMNRD